MMKAIKGMFWPAVTVVFTLSVFALWFSGRGVEDDISARLEALKVMPENGSYQVDGRDVLLRATVADDAAREQLLAAIGALSGVRQITPEITIAAKNVQYSFFIVTEADTVTLTGTIPPTVDRYRVLEAVEQKKPGIAVYDEMMTTAGTLPHFEAWVNYLISILPELDNGVIGLKGAALSGDDLLVKEISRRDDIPPGLIVAETAAQ